MKCVKIRNCLLAATCLLAVAWPTYSNTAEGWEFAVRSVSVTEMSGEQGYRVCAEIHNKSTNPSYKRSDCSRGCGTTNIRFDASNPDAGAIRALSTGKQAEICNGESENVCFDNASEPHNWGVVSMTVTLSSPGGGMFDKQTKVFRF
jgi:hypothetical protein